MPSGTFATNTYFATVVDTAIEGNEAPEFSADTYAFTISENVMDAHEIGMLTVTDDDGTKLFSIIQDTYRNIIVLYRLSSIRAQ